MNKQHFFDHEKYGLNEEEILKGEKFLRKNKTFGVIPKEEASKIYELFLIGHSFRELHEMYRCYPEGQIILTAALNHWIADRERFSNSLATMVQSKLLKSVVDQVDFLSTTLAVTRAEHMEKMKKYIEDPINNKPPDFRILSIKDYKEIVDSLSKMISSINGSGSSRRKNSEDGDSGNVIDKLMSGSQKTTKAAEHIVNKNKLSAQESEDFFADAALLLEEDIKKDKK